MVEGIDQGPDAALLRALELFLPTMLLLLGNQSMYQKFFSARSERDARISVFGWIIGTVILETVIVTIAVFGAALYLHAPDVKPREIIAYSARHGLPAFLGALLMGAVFAKVISTANNYLFSPATNLVNDVYTRFINRDASNRQVLLISRLVVIGLGVWALLQGAYTESILQKALYAYTIYSAAITPVVMAAFFWKRASAAGAVSSIAAGTLVTVFWNLGAKLLPPALAQRDAIMPALIVSVISLALVSVLTPAPRPEQWAPFFAEDAANSGAES